MGKSAVVEEVIGLASDQGWPVLPFRMDEVEADDRTARAVGSRLGLRTSPAALIAQVARGGPALLVVDQLDAVSSYSGRIPEVFEAVDEMLDALATSPNVKVVLVARTVDVEKDPRLTSLVGQEDTVERFALGLLDDQAVRAVLEQGGTPPEKLDTETLVLLRTPLHLAVFSRLTKGARTTAYRSLQDLYAQYTDDKRREAERSLPHETWPAITQQLVEEMSRRETVTVPYALLDRFARTDLAVLSSAGILLHAENGRIGFFHETYFDYLFARSFVLAGHDLHDFPAAGGQALFRRAQTRQVLEHLRDTDRTAFRHTAVRLLTSDLVRPHLRFVVVAVLEQLDATSEDWAALEPHAWGEDVTSGNLRHLLALPSWFEAAYGASLLQGMFHDNSAAVRTAAACAMTGVMSLSPAAADRLISAFLGSPSLAEHPETLARALAESAARLPSRAIEACQALATISERDSRQGRRGYALIQRHLIEAVLRLYRQGDTEVRAQCLDIIDALYRTGAHGLTAALSGER
ncbi:hypothetical protein ACIQRK_32750 [Streptomyces anulatus]